MNFEQWFEKQVKIGYPIFLDYESAKLAWDAAKEESLKLIKEYSYLVEPDHGGNYENISNVEDLAKDIEKL